MPVFSFGENELFNQVSNPQGSIIRRLQERLQRVMGLALPLFHARGVFQYNFGLLPFRRPIYTVGECVCCSSQGMLGWSVAGEPFGSCRLWLPMTGAPLGQGCLHLGQLSPSTFPHICQHFSEPN